jgi:hypothetical protein
MMETSDQPHNSRDPVIPGYFYVIYYPEANTEVLVSFEVRASTTNLLSIWIRA